MSCLASPTDGTIMQRRPEEDQEDDGIGILFVFGTRLVFGFLADDGVK
jgi:hypothetical protein